MGLNNDEDVNEGQDNNTTTVTDAPTTSAPFDRESFVEDTFKEGIEESVLEELSGKENVTIDDLRKIPGTEGMSDEQLTAAWDKAQKEAGGEDGAAADTKIEVPFPVYDAAGNKIASDKVTLGDLLSGKALVGYQAMGKEQRKSLSDVLRNASQGHWNEHRYTTVQGQYREASAKVGTLEGQVKEFETQREQWNSALTALITGNNAPMRALVEAYKNALGRTGQAVPEGYVPQEQVQAERENAERGMQWWTEVGLPSAYELSNKYGADSKEVQGAIQWYINNEPNLTPQRIEEIIKYDVPYLLEQNGYKANGEPASGSNATGTVTPAGSNNEVETLKQQIAALTQRITGSANDRTQAVRDKQRKTPPAGSGATSGAGESMPSFKSRAEMKEYLQS